MTALAGLLLLVLGSVVASLVGVLLLPDPGEDGC